MNDDPGNMDQNISHPVPESLRRVRPCTCHPGERPFPCPHIYALRDCLAAWWAGSSVEPDYSSAATGSGPGQEAAMPPAAPTDHVEP